ncbi:MAG: hypothetical protein GY791_06855 [Alphaproteobacteria bacterium]|nr:hypothetical protein [Alphaproteobacteria bacterium]
MMSVVGVLTAFHPATAESNESLEAEYDQLFRELLRQPNDLDNMARFAYVATQLRNYEAAIQTFERMLLINPNLPTIKLEIGVLYYRLKAYDTAKVYLEDALTDPAMPPISRARAQRYLDEVDERVAASTFSGAVLAGIRYQDNANAGPDGPFILSGGFPAMIPTGFQPTDDINGFVSGRVRHRYDLATPLDEAWVTDAEFYGTAQVDLDQYNVGFMELRTGPRIAVLPQSVDTLFVRPFFISNVSFIGQDLYGYGFGGGVDLEKEYGDDTKVGLRYIGLYRDFQNISVFPNDSEDGVQHRLTFWATDRPNEDWVLYGQVRGFDVQANSPQNAYHRVDVYGRIGYYYDAPFDLAWPWQVSVGGWYIYREYDAPDPVVSPFVTRQDDEYRIAISNDFQIDRDWSIFWQLEYISVDSNLPNYTYDNLSTLVAARKRF